MASERTAKEVRTRFADEQSYIQRYTAFVARNLQLDDKRIMQVAAILKKLHVSCPRIAPSRKPWCADTTEQDHMAALADGVRALDQAIRDERSVLQQECPDQVVEEYLKAKAKHQDYLESRYGEKLLTNDPDQMAKECLIQLKKKNRSGADSVDITTIERGIRHAVGYRRARRLQSLLSAKAECDEIQLLARTLQPDAEINVLRQGFILLMTAFDAAIFDLVRVKLRNDFFKLIGMFGKQEKVSLSEIGEAGSFDALREGIVEDQMKKRYIKDLLIVLDSHGVKCSDEPAGDSLGNLIELVLRRNVHVHNRGVVDERYLERDQQTGKFRFNLYSLNLGQTAIIDELYWESANRLSKSCVERVADWAAE